MEALHITEGDVLILSDAHFGMGAVLPNGKPNPNESFLDDRAFAAMLKSWKRRCERLRPKASEGVGSKKRWLIFNGDMIDYHAIPFEGSYRCVATEEAALAETKICLDAHPVVFAAMTEFVATDLDAELVYVDGNHDLELSWPSVREMILSRIDPSGSNRDRIHFTREVRYGDDVLIAHGDELDGLSRKPKSEHTFITGKVDPLPAVLAAVLVLFSYSALVTVAKAMWSGNLSFSLEEILLAMVGFFALLSLVSAFIVKVVFSAIGKERVYLNHPTSTYMNSWLGQRLKRWLPWIGRMQDHGALWFMSLVSNWTFTLLALPVLLGYIFYHRFIIEVLDPRREHKRARFTLWETLKLLRSTMQGDHYDAQLESFVDRRPKVKFLIMGHTHVAEDRIIRFSDRKLRYINTGTMLRQVRLISPQPETEPLPWIKMFFWRIVVYWKKRPWSAAVLTLLHFVLGSVVFFGFWHEGWTVLAWIALVITAFSLFWRQSYAQYRGEDFTEFTPAEIRMTEDGTREITLMHYIHQEDRWTRYLES